MGTNTKGTWTFPNLSDFMNNRASSVTQAVGTATSEPRQNLMGVFFQDDFKISRNLTLNIGLRYEYNTIPLGLFGATDPKIVASGVPGPAHDDKNNWAPRLGLAYSPNPSGGLARTLLGSGQTVFRGGYGIAYDQLYLNLLSNAAGNPPRIFSDIKTTPDTYNLYPTLPRITTTPRRSIRRRRFRIFPSIRRIRRLISTVFRFSATLRSPMFSRSRIREAAAIIRSGSSIPIMGRSLRLRPRP